MQRYTFILFISLFSIFTVVGQNNNPAHTSDSALQSTLPQTSQQRRPKIGVVLSGGGAKGFSHIGVLKVLEEVGIPIDYITGTSMGAIVGALYSIGYDANTIDSLVRMQDWPHLLSDDVYRKYLPASLKDGKKGFIFSLPYELKLKERKGQVKLPPGVVRGQNLYSLFLNLTIGYQHAMQFDELPIPFACVAADARSGAEIVFHEGVLPEAIRASMAIPGLFAPVEKDSLLLIDGGLINNYPVDVIREMGADIVIGIQMPRDLKEDEKYRGSLSEVIGQLWNFIGQDKLVKNTADTDILIEPYLHPFGMLDFDPTSIDTIIHRGETAGRKMLPVLMELKKSLALTEQGSLHKAIRNPYLDLDTLEIKSVRIEGLSKIEEKGVIKGIDIKDNKVTRQELSDITSRIYGSGLFTKVYYRLDGDAPFNLVFTVEERNQNTLDLGIRFDTKDMAAILAHTAFRLSSTRNSILGITARLSRDPYLKMNYSMNSGPFYKGGFTGRIGRNEIDIYQRGESDYKLNFTRSTFQFNLSEFYLYNIRLHLGANIDNFHFIAKLKNESNKQDIPQRLKNKLYINYFVSGVFDNLNKAYLPTSGQYFSFQYALHTDNAYQMFGKAPLNMLAVHFHKPIHLSGKLYMTPEISGRTLFNVNDSIPLVYANFVGGQYHGHNLPQQIALQGSRGMELMKNTVAVLSTEFRYHFTPKQQLFVNLNGTVQNDELLQLPNGDYLFGGSIGYSNATMLGPLTLELGYSGLSKSVFPFVSIGHYF